MILRLMPYLLGAACAVLARKLVLCHKLNRPFSRPGVDIQGPAMARHCRVLARFVPLCAFAMALLVPARAHAAAADQIDLSSAIIIGGSPTDVASWPATGQITQLTMSRPAGLAFEFTTHNTWPDYTPPGWNGPIEYTVWAMVKINGQWYASGFIQMWRDRPSTGAPLTQLVSSTCGTITNWQANWADCRGLWGIMHTYAPKPGDQMGFFLTAGNQRLTDGHIVRERTNVVSVTLPVNDTGVFTFPLRGSATSVIMRDFDNDGLQDLIVQEDGGLVTLALNSGTDFAPLQSPFNNIQTSWKVVAADDFNNDGAEDLVWQSPAGAVQIWLNNGASAPTSIYAFNGSTTWRVVATGDVDGNGTPDLIWQNTNGAVAVWYMTGTTVGTKAVVFGGSTVWRLMGAADFNGDGHPDLVWQNPSGAVLLWYMNGLTMTSAQYISTASTLWKVASVTDVNGDGKPDLVWRGPTGTMSVWILNGIAAAQYKFLLPSGTSNWVLSNTP